MNHTPPQTTEPALIREKETIQLVGLSKSTIRNLTLKGLFPPSFKISERASARSRPEVRRWIEARRASAASPKEPSHV